MATVTIYLKYDSGQLRYSLDDRSFSPIDIYTQVNANSGDLVIWTKSSSDTALTKIKIKNLSKKDGERLSKGKWKDTWKTKPTNVTKTECSGVPQDSGATKDDPSFFAYDIQYNIDGGRTQTLDPTIKLPQD
jgi:hypothetical protein